MAEEEKRLSVKEIYEKNTREKRICAALIVGDVEFTREQQKLADYLHYQKPAQVIHVEEESVRMSAESVLWSQLIQPLWYPNLMVPKRFYLVYGMDGSGKTLLVQNIYKALENTQLTCDTCVHFRVHCNEWNLAEVKNCWALTIQFIKKFFLLNPNCYVLLELEMFHFLCENLPSPDLKEMIFKQLQNYRMLFIIATTSKPEVCREAFLPYVQTIAAAVFVSKPTQQNIEEMLRLKLFNLFHIFPMTQEKIVDNLSGWCQDAAAQLYRKGVSMLELKNVVIPRISNMMRRARLFWYDNLNQCMPLSSTLGTCDPTREHPASVNERQIQQILEKVEPLTLNDIQVLNPKVLCENLQRVCTGDMSDLELDITWLESVWDMFVSVSNFVVQDTKFEDVSERYGELSQFQLRQKS